MRGSIRGNRRLNCGFELKTDITKNDNVGHEVKKENGFRQNFHIKKSNLSYAHLPVIQ